MTDGDAARVIAEGDGEYCPKSVWKRFHDRNADDRRTRRVHIMPNGKVVDL